jgi:hypothetical protein
MNRTATELERHLHARIALTQAIAHWPMCMPGPDAIARHDHGDQA